MYFYKLYDIFDFETGVNPSRYTLEKETTFYDSESFDIDFVSNYEGDKTSYNNKENIVLEGNLIFNLSSQKCVITSKTSNGKILTSNFVKMIPKKEIDFNYITYLLNEDDNIKKQKEIGLQGSGIQRITVSFLKGIQIPYLNIDKQIKIGYIYRKSILLKNEINNYSELLGKATNSFIKEFLEGEYHE